MRALLMWVVWLVLMFSVFEAMPDDPRPAEDSPAWNCHTMGNHVCGPAQYPAWEKP